MPRRPQPRQRSWRDELDALGAKIDRPPWTAEVVRGYRRKLILRISRPDKPIALTFDTRRSLMLHRGAYSTETLGHFTGHGWRQELLAAIDDALKTNT